MISRIVRESLYKGFSFNLEVDKVIFEEKTQHQNLLIFENSFFGKVMMLDDIIQLTTRDEFIYHEMMTHVPIFSLERPENVLIIGGGDGGIAREVLKHKNIKSCTEVEIDRSVIDLSLKYFPEISNGAYLDSRMNLIIEDGVKFVKETKKKFDIIIVDSTDPIGPGAVLFSEEFYSYCEKCLTKNGILITQNGVPFFQSSELEQSILCFKKVFKYSSCYLATIPTYIGGFMSIGYATNGSEQSKINSEDINQRIKLSNLKTKYYNSLIHKASFHLPNFIKEIVN